MSFKKYFTILLVFTLLFVGSNVSASFSDGFDTYTDGSLNGQGGWDSLVELFEVQATTTQAGLKAIFYPQGASNGIKKYMGSKNGRVIAWIQTTLPTTSDSIVFGVGDSHSYAYAEMYFTNTGTLDFWGDSMESIVIDYSPDTWYKVEIEWRNSDGKVRARANDGTWTSWLVAQHPGNPWTEMSYVYLSNGGGEGYWDSLTYNESYLTISTNFTTSTLAYAGQLFTDLSPVVILSVGLPLGFWVIKKIILLVKTR